MEKFSITGDLEFKAVFGKDCYESKQALSSLLSAIMGQEVTDIEFINQEPAADGKHEKNIRFDIAVTYADGDRIAVEIQTSDRRFLKSRFIYYLCKLYLSQDAKGNIEYADLKKCCVIIIKSFGSRNEKLIRRFRMLDEDKLLYSDDIQLVEVNLNAVQGNDINESNIMKVDKSLLWMYFLKYCDTAQFQDIIKLIIESEGDIAMAEKKYYQISKSEREAILELKELMHRDSIYDMGYDEGMEAGEAKGLAEGEAKKERQTLEKLANKFGLETAADMLDLTLTEAKKILEEN